MIVSHTVSDKYINDLYTTDSIMQKFYGLSGNFWNLIKAFVIPCFLDHFPFNLFMLGVNSFILIFI